MVVLWPGSLGKCGFPCHRLSKWFSVIDCFPVGSRGRRVPSYVLVFHVLVGNSVVGLHPGSN